MTSPTKPPVRLQYKIIVAQSLDTLESRVNDAVLDGYVPKGGVATWKQVSPEYYGPMFAQAMLDNQHN